MEYLLASARYAEEANHPARARALYHDAQALLREIQEAQSPEGRAALAVHPWQTAIRRGIT